MCPSCGVANGVVKKGALLKIVHDQGRCPGKTKKSDGGKHSSLFRDAVAYNKDIGPLVNRALEVITPLRALELFRGIRPDEVSWLDSVNRWSVIVLTFYL